MRTVLLLFVGLCLGCRAGSHSAAGKSPTDQTFAPADQSGESKFPSSAAAEPVRPPPTIIIQPTDLTSSVGTSPIVVGVDNLGDRVGNDILGLLAKEIRLQDAQGAPVPIGTTIMDASGSTYGPSGYRTNEIARIVVVPQSPLKNEWHVLRISATPAGLAWPGLSDMETLPDGSRGVRVAPGSHPTPTSIRLCDKGQGLWVTIVDWSERIVYPEDVRTIADVQEESSGLTSCVPDPAISTDGTTESLRFLCQNFPATGAKLSIGLTRTIRSSSGTSAEFSSAPPDATGALRVPSSSGPVSGSVGDGKVWTHLNVSDMKPWGEGCRIMRPW
jgi:hypothetical protein